MKRLKAISGALFAGVLGLAIGAVPAAALPITTDTWYTFGFGAPGSALGAPGALGNNPASLALDGTPWTFNLSGPATVLITDLETSGDYFTLFDNAVFLGTSDTGVPNATSVCVDDITCALGNANYGKGSFALGAGSHSLTGVFNGVINNGDGALIIQQVPEPLTFSLFSVGLVGAAVARRRKNKSA